MHPYVAALEHACVITIKWAWLRSLAMHDRSFEAETQHETELGLVLRLFGRLFFDHTLIFFLSAVLINQPFELRLLYREVSAQ